MASHLVTTRFVVGLRNNAYPVPPYQNVFLNLGVPVFQLAEPFPAEKTQITPSVSITIWDQWDIKLGDITLTQFVQHFLVSSS